MLSQVERGETSPTLVIAERIAAGLDLTLSQLLRLDEGEHVVVTRAGAHRERDHDGHLTEELTPPLPGQRADVSRHLLEPGAATGRTGDPPLHEPGARETAVVLAGSVALMIDDERHDLDAGDSVTFDADLPHHFTNDGRRAGRVPGRGRRRATAELTVSGAKRSRCRRRRCSTRSGTRTRSATG